MAEKLNKNKLGMTLGVFIALWHLVWALLVAVGIGENLLDWALPLHFVSMTFTILEFNIINALILVIAAFVGGYVMGWVFAALWNCKCMKK